MADQRAHGEFRAHNYTRIETELWRKWKQEKQKIPLEINEAVQNEPLKSLIPYSFIVTRRRELP